MSWSDRAPGAAAHATAHATARAGVLTPAQLADLLGAQAPAAADWQPGELGGTLAPAIGARDVGAHPLDAGAEHGFVPHGFVMHDFADAAPTARAGAAAAAAPSADPFADALPDFAALGALAAGEAMSPAGLAALQAAQQAAAEREDALQARFEQELAARLAEQQAAHEQALQEAWAAGVEAGRAEGEASAEQVLAGAVAAFADAAEQTRAGADRWLANLEENLAALAAGAARHVVAREVAADPTIVRELARRAVAEFPVDEPLAVRVHPDDLAPLKAAQEHFTRPSVAGIAPRELRWIADPRMARGGLLVEGRERIVDGRVDTALERVYRVLAQHQA